jgi:hypothetical protein
MLHEPASSHDYIPAQPQDDFSQADTYLRALQAAIEQVMVVEKSVLPFSENLRVEDRALLQRDDREFVMSYVGKLKLPPEAAYEQLDERLAFPR